MTFSSDDLVRMERAHVAAWPALRTAGIDGWLWRASGGGSQRANSVSTVDFTGTSAAAAIDAAEHRYRAAGALPRFQTYDHTAPAELQAVLRARGYRETEATSTMIKRPARTAAAGTQSSDAPWDAWLDVYLGGVTENRRAVNREILQRVPHPRRFFGTEVNGTLVSTALCVIAHGCAVIECVATAAAARRQGAARSVLRALEDWAADQAADLLGLQVVATNAGAVALYQGLGFTASATNRFWVPAATDDPSGPAPNSERPHRP